MGGGGLDFAEKRKMIEDIKREMKPLVSSLCEFQIQKSNSVMKTTMRKFENDLTIAIQQLTKKIERDVKEAKKMGECAVAALTDRLEDEIRLIQKKIARDRADNDLRFNNNKEIMEAQTKKLDQHDT